MLIRCMHPAQKDKKIKKDKLKFKLILASQIFLAGFFYALFFGVSNVNCAVGRQKVVGLNEYDQLLIKLCHELLPYLRQLGASQMEAEDISQDIFIMAWQAELILPPKQLQAYLRKAAKSRYFDHWRHRQRTQQLWTRY